MRTLMGASRRRDAARIKCRLVHDHLPQELADEMLHKANELAGNELLSGRHAVKLIMGLAHILVVEERRSHLAQ